MGAGHALSPETTFHLTLVRLTLAALSLVLVGASTVLGLQLSRLHGAMAGFVTAIWFELIFFAPRALSEPIALAPLMGAVLDRKSGVSGKRVSVRVDPGGVRNSK